MTPAAKLGVGLAVTLFVLISIRILTPEASIPSPSVDSGSSPPSPKPESSYRLPDQITLTASAIRSAGNGTVIEGTTNLPTGTRIGVELMKGEMLGPQDFKVYVDSGKFSSAAFTNGTSPIPPGRQKVHIFTRFNAVWQSESVLKLVGKDGANLKPSEVILIEDRQLLDSDKILEYSTELIIPPLISAPRKSDAVSQPPATGNDKAIEIVKKAVLVVDGRRSAMNVEAGFNYFHEYAGGNSVHMGNGWSATPTGNDTYNVVLDFINVVAGKEEHDTALWEVNVVTKEVLYRNKYAKYFSFIPDY